jgi:hypothetical protein
MCWYKKKRRGMLYLSLFETAPLKSSRALLALVCFSLLRLPSASYARNAGAGVNQNIARIGQMTNP